MSFIKRIFKELFDIEPHERLKVLLLWFTFFLVIGSYTVTRELKSAIFAYIVGKDFVGWAKIASMIILVPLTLLYSKLADRMKQYQLLSFYSVAFGILGLLCCFYIGHPTIGILNNNANPNRLFGWFFYFFIECYTPFIVSIFWAFANSITSPEGAKKNYGLIVSGSKTGGALTSAIAWYLLDLSSQANNPFFTHTVTHQIILFMSSIMVLLVPITITLLIKLVPNKYLHGYEAAYQEDKQAAHQKTGIFAGLSMLAKYPYVFGIFGLVFFYEVISTVLSFLRISVAEAHAHNISGMSQILLEMAFKTHIIGFVISSLGTRALCNKLGTAVCLLLVPLLTGIFLLYLMIAPTKASLINAFVLFKAIHYAFSWPIRESLYIPTVKEIKFKSRSWIDAFGSKLARSSGSVFNIATASLGSALILPIHSFFFAVIIGLWFLTAFLLGRRFEKAINNNEVIGATEGNIV